MRVLLIVLPICALLAASPLAAGSTTRFQRGEQGGVIVPVRLNDAGPFLLLLDTGATHSAITETVAAAIDAPAVATSNVVSPATVTRRTIVAIDRFDVGPSTTDVVLASVVPDRSLDVDGKIQGLIGQDVLAHLRFTIDFDRRQVQWHSESTPHHGVSLPLSLEHGRFLVDLPQDGQPLRLVPDSGAGGLVLFGAGETRPRLARHTGRMVRVATAEGQIEAKEIVLNQFQIGDRVFPNVRGVRIDRPAAHPGEGDGLLPLHLFGRVSFDGPARRLFVG